MTLPDPFFGPRRFLTNCRVHCRLADWHFSHGRPSSHLTFLLWHWSQATRCSWIPFRCAIVRSGECGNRHFIPRHEPGSFRGCSNSPGGVELQFGPTREWRPASSGGSCNGPWKRGYEAVMQAKDLQPRVCPHNTTVGVESRSIIRCGVGLPAWRWGQSKRSSQQPKPANEHQESSEALPSRCAVFSEMIVRRYRRCGLPPGIVRIVMFFGAKASWAALLLHWVHFDKERSASYHQRPP
jgi:hypothetical protein